MRRAWSLVLVALLGLGGQASAADPARVELTAPKTVEGLRLADVDEDGAADIVVIEGRTVRIYRGRKGALPEAAPSWTGNVPPDVSFVDVAPPSRLIALGEKGVTRIPVFEDGAVEEIKGSEALTWHDSNRVVLAELVRAGGLLLPSKSGVRFQPFAGKPIPVELQPAHTVKAPGPFLEDTCNVVRSVPAVFIGRDGVPRGRAGDSVGVWVISGTTLAFENAAGQREQWDLSFLGAESEGKEVEQTLEDLDGDGRPDLIHRIFTNRDSRYGFFRTRLREKNDASKFSPTHKPAVSDIYLSGFQLPMELIDLDGDGRKDLVITSIQINAANTLRALSSGVVSAETRAFLNRSAEGGTFFRTEADALVKSDILVKVRFNYAGTVEVERSFTILLDGDFDGDGRKDLAIRTSATTMTVRRGTAKGVWEAEGKEIAIPPMGDAPDVDGYTADLDGDGKDEIALHYRGPEGGKDRLWVVRTP